MDERTKKLKEIHDSIYSTLNRLQTQVECNKTKIIRCHNSLMSGFGSSINRHVICLHIAFSLERSFIITHDDIGFNGLATFTNIESEKCGNLRGCIYGGGLARQTGWLKYRVCMIRASPVTWLASTSILHYVISII